MASSQSAAMHNRLPASLPHDALAALLPKLSPIILSQRQPIYNPDAPAEAVHFPEPGMISLVAPLDDGAQAEVGIIGREGMPGTSLLAGVDASFIEALVQMPGTGLRMTLRDFRHEMEAGFPLRMLMLRYNEAVQAKSYKTAACNGRDGL